MNKIYLYILLLICFASCSEQETLSIEDSDAIELQGVEAEISGGASTRAAALDANNYVGRSAFIDKDQMVLTSLKRTDSPIPGFSYTGIVYDQEIEAGQTSGGWNRDKTQGRTEASEAHPERIYWSDAANYHTYIGYSLPQQPSSPSGETEGVFDWNLRSAYDDASHTTSIPVYYGSLGTPTSATETYIDYDNDSTDVGQKDDPENANSTVSYKSGNEKLKHDDLLLTWDNKKLAETGGSVAKLSYHHALAMVRVIVNIQGFSASTDAADSKSIVSNMVLKDMLTLYKWRQQNNCAEALDATYDAANIAGIYGSGVTCDQKKDTHLWIPHPAGTGTGVGKQFTFYGLAVPRTMGVDNATGDKTENLHLEFKVHYQDPMNPWKDPATEKEPNMKDHIYKATMPNLIEFRAGYCTTINISLNHSNEKMTIGAEYMDWQYVETPDQGELKKNPNFLTYIPTSEPDRIAKKIYVADDAQATEDDAIWLYKTTKNGENVVVDIYGNDGTEENPYIIKTANQLLSFAYEVKKGREFYQKRIKLDTDMVMQSVYDLPVDSAGHVIEQGLLDWIGIGDDDHPFRGIFYGENRNIHRLKGAALFTYLAHDAIVDRLTITDVVKISDTGCLAEKNDGIVCGCHLEGDIVSTDTSKDYCGSIVGNNDNGVVIACSHIGDTKGYGTVGALVGYNNGMLAMCYNAGDAKNAEVGQENENAYAGVGIYTKRSIAYCCYFNSDLYTSNDYGDLKAEGTIGHVAFPLTTAEMQSNKFVNAPAGTEITDVRDKGETTENPLPLTYYHWSLNRGIDRIIELLENAESMTPDAEGNVYVFLMPMKHYQAVWLKNHYSSANHHFRYIPGTYPKLQ